MSYSDEAAYAVGQLGRVESGGVEGAGLGRGTIDLAGNTADNGGNIVGSGVGGVERTFKKKILSVSNIAQRAIRAIQKERD